MRKLFLSILLSLLFLPPVSHAVEFDVSEIRPAISGDSIVRVSKNIIFDASSTFLLDTGETVRYQWDLGDGTTISGEEVVHTYGQAGSYTVTLTVTQGTQTQALAREVFAYNKLIFLLTDVTERQENILNLKEDAAEEGTYIFVVESYGATTAFMSEEALYSQLNDNLSNLISADAIAIWTTRGSGRI